MAEILESRIFVYANDILRNRAQTSIGNIGEVKVIEITANGKTTSLLVPILVYEIYFKGVVYDFSFIRETLFKKQRTPFSSYTVGRDDFLYNEVTIKIPGELVNTYGVVNGSFDFDINNYLIKDYVFQFRKLRSRLKKYAGYPLSVDLLCDKTAFNKLNLNGVQVSTISLDAFPYINFQIPDGVFVLSVTSNIVDTESQLVSNDLDILVSNDLSLLTSKGANIPPPADQRVFIDAQSCIPENPFYVRFLTKLGSWEYQMFERREKKVTLSDRESYLQDSFKGIKDVYALRGARRKQLGGKENVVVTCCARNITMQEVEILQQMITSRCIEYYDPNLSGFEDENKYPSWEEITVANFPVISDRGETGIDFSVEFLMPYQNI